ncbi:unnamed protein product, partial [Didymodactylos carnosus]
KNNMNFFPSNYDDTDDQVVFTMSNDDDPDALCGIDDDLCGSSSDHEDTDVFLPTRQGQNYS